MPKRNYRQKTTGKTVKGVTTILSTLAKPALLFWAFKQGMSNFDRLMEILAQHPSMGPIIQNFQATGLYDKRDKAADAGTLAHLFVENHLRELPDPKTDGIAKDVVNKAEGCYLAFLNWEKANQIKVIDSEVELTSEQYPYGGTIDHIVTAAMTPKDEVDILDIKTGKDIYLEAKLQVAAYGVLVNSCTDLSVSSFHILRLGENGEFTHKYFPSLDEGYFKIFLACLDITTTLEKLGEKI